MKRKAVLLKDVKKVMELQSFYDAVRGGLVSSDTIGPGENFFWVEESDIPIVKKMGLDIIDIEIKHEFNYFGRNRFTDGIERPHARRIR